MKKTIYLLICTIICNAFALEAVDLTGSRCSTCGGANKKAAKKERPRRHHCRRCHHHRNHHRKIKIPTVKVNSETFNWAPGIGNN